MAIPTYEIGAVDGTDLLIQYPNSMSTIGFTEGAQIFDGCRLYMDPIIVGNSSPLYGPGSTTYEITKCELVTSGDIPTVESMLIDPKTYIDNYGYVHIGKSNRPNSEMTENQTIRVTFKSNYHYINPSDGDVVEVKGETYFQAINDIDSEILAERNRSIPYSALSGNIAAD